MKLDEAGGAVAVELPENIRSWRERQKARDEKLGESDRLRRKLKKWDMLRIRRRAWLLGENSYCHREERALIVIPD